MDNQKITYRVRNIEIFVTITFIKYSNSYNNVCNVNVVFVNGPRISHMWHVVNDANLYMDVYKIVKNQQTLYLIKLSNSFEFSVILRPFVTCRMSQYVRVNSL